MSVDTLIDQLAQDVGFISLRETLEAERDKIVDRILTGQLDPQEYARACGEVSGLDRVLKRARNPRPLGQR